jgi:hypothetical protein
MEKEFQKGKGFAGHFPRRWPASTASLAHYHARARTASRYRAADADDWDPPVGAFSPKSSSALARVAKPAELPSSSQPLVTTPVL